MKNKLLLLIIIFNLVSCAPAHFVKPLAEKQQAVNLSVGGPLVDHSDLTIPVPFVTLGYGYGIDSSLTSFGALNVTSAIYGNLQLELGVTKELYRPKRNMPGLSIASVANIIYRPKEVVKLYPQIDVNAYWDFNRHRNYFYAGISNWFELSGKKASGLKQKNHWLISPIFGHSFVRKKWDFILEAKIIAPGLKNNYNTVDYKTPLGTHGAFGIYFGYTRKF